MNLKKFGETVEMIALAGSAVVMLGLKSENKKLWKRLIEKDERGIVNECGYRDWVASGKPDEFDAMAAYQSRTKVQIDEHVAYLDACHRHKTKQN